MDPSDLRELFEERGIRRVKVGGFDLDGLLRGKYISLEKFWSAVETGFGFCDVIFGWDIGDALYDNATLTGWHTGFPDTPARIDLSTLRILPSEPDTATFLADFADPDGQPHPACPRNLLKSIVARAEAAGYRPCFAAEFEFWIFDETPASVAAKGYRDLKPLSSGMFGYSWVREGQHSELLIDILETLQAFDIEVEGLHTETGPGVYEAALRYDDALRAADMAALFKTTLKQICSRHDTTVTFMAKWNSDLPGSSGHLHQSLWDPAHEQNLFVDKADPAGLSPLARHYLGGQIASMRELTALYSPTVNSYKRYVPGVWAPLTASWGVENRTCAVRVINGPKETATRLEFRQTAADINPYIAMATCLAAGLHGIEERIEPPPPVVGDATGEINAENALPMDLGAAVAALRSSRTAGKILGEAFVDHFLRTRDWELRQHGLAVSDWERQRYFEAI